uniref:Bacterial surface antigen (D15) domain-containing protein n=1 Tax=candidate division WOR-3 bacterium TaxID=2052148 RepID=A0A7C4YHL3_UNCW3
MIFIISIFINPHLKFFTIQNRNFKIIYPEGYDSIGQEVSLLSERIYEKMCDFYKLEKLPQANIVLLDNIDIPNGYSYNFPRNTIFIFLKRGEFFEYGEYDDWIKIVLIHEYTHIIEGERKGIFPFNILRFIFGKRYLSYNYAPIGFIEGFAVYSETKNSSFGRTNSVFFKEILSNLKDDFPSINEFLSGEYKKWPYDYTPYIIGSFFFAFIESLYGEDVVINIGKSISENPITIDLIFRKYTKRSLNSLWKEFKEIYSNKDIEKDGIKITKDGGYKRFLTGNREYISYANLYSGEENPYFMICKKKFSYYPSGRGIFKGNFYYQPIYIMKDNFAIMSKILRIDLRNKKGKIIKGYERVKDIAVDKNGNVFYVKDNTIFKGDTLLFSSPYQIENISISNSDTMLCFTLHNGEKNGIFIFNLINRSIKNVIFNDNLYLEPSFSDDEKYIIFTSGKDNEFKIYAYDIYSGEFYFIVRGYSPFIRGDTLYYLSFNNKGVDIYKKQFKLLEPEFFINEGEITYKNIEKKEYIPRKNYNAFNYLFPSGWEPFFQPEEFGNVFGLHFYNTDPLGNFQYDIAYYYYLLKDRALSKYDRSLISFSFEFTKLVNPILNFYCELYYPRLSGFIEGSVISPNFSLFSSMFAGIGFYKYFSEDFGFDGIFSYYQYSTMRKENNLISPVGFQTKIELNLRPIIYPGFDIMFKKNFKEIIFATRFFLGISYFSDLLYETRNIKPTVISFAESPFNVKCSFSGEIRFPLIKKTFGIYPFIIKDISGTFYYDKISWSDLGYWAILTILSSKFLYYFSRDFFDGETNFPTYYGGELNLNIGFLNQFDQRIRIGFAHAKMSNRNYIYIARDWSF